MLVVTIVVPLYNTYYTFEEKYANFNKFYNGYEPIIHIIPMIYLGKIRKF